MCVLTIKYKDYIQRILDRISKALKVTMPSIAFPPDMEKALVGIPIRTIADNGTS